MKKSELKNEIKNYIYEILSEVDVDPKSGAVVMKKGTNPNDIKKVTAQGIDVELREDEDSTPDDETVDKQAQAAAKKEKIQGPSKFKVPNSEFEDFKTKLKNLVKKIKAMEKGAEKDKKMAALKQFIKKPELVKAFKERDVQIDTGGLVGENRMIDRTISGKQVDPEFDIYTYDHLLPKGTGDNFTPHQLYMMMRAAENDAKLLKQQNRKIKINKDDNGVPYLEII
jgi:hypothetical protein